MQKTTPKIVSKKFESELPAEHDSSLSENDDDLTQNQRTVAGFLPKVHQSDAVETDKEIKKIKEINGPKGLEPTRYGDWESKGRCFDF